MVDNNVAISLGDLRMVSPYKIIAITDVSWKYRYNIHSELIIYTITDLEPTTNSYHVPVNIYYKGDVLFSGVIERLEYNYKNQLHILKYTILSATVLMDVSIRNRSFQNYSMTHDELNSEIIKNYSASNIVSLSSTKNNIERLIIQYKETDWEFQLRTASHLNTIVYPNMDTPYPRYYIGIPKGNYADINLSHYMSSKFNKGDNLLTFNDIYFYNIGTAFYHKNKEYIISAFTANTEKSMLSFTYTAQTRNSMKIDWIYNTKFQGVSFLGKVIDRKGEFVKLHLNIDAAQPVDTACFFRHAPESVSLLYAIPELDDYCYLKILNEDEHQSLVSGCPFRISPNRLLFDIESKQFNTKEEKNIVLTPDNIQINNGRHSYDLTLNQSAIRLNPKNNLKIYSEKSIFMIGKSNISLGSIHEIYLKNKSTGRYIHMKEKMLFGTPKLDIKSNKDILSKREDSSKQRFKDIRKRTKITTKLTKKSISPSLCDVSSINDKKESAVIAAITSSSTPYSVAAVNSVEIKPKLFI